MYGKPGRHETTLATEEGWALFGVADGKPRLRLEVRGGQLVLRDTAQAESIRWSGLLRAQGQIWHVESLEGEGVTSLPEVRYREGIDMSQPLRARPATGGGPGRTVTLKLRQILEAALRGEEYVDI